MKTITTREELIKIINEVYNDENSEEVSEYKLDVEGIDAPYVEITNNGKYSKFVTFLNRNPHDIKDGEDGIGTFKYEDYVRNNTMIYLYNKMGGERYIYSKEKGKIVMCWKFKNSENISTCPVHYNERKHISKNWILNDLD